MTYWAKVLFVVAVLAIVAHQFQQPMTEGFSQSGDFEIKSEKNMFDDFYADIYDQLVGNAGKVDFETGEIARLTHIGRESRVIDVGCGNGHHVAALSRMTRHVLGIDQSVAMIARARKLYPKCNFSVGRAEQALEWGSMYGKYSHVCCLYFTVYYFDDRRAFFDTAFDGLIGGGHLLLHLVRRDKFDPIIPAGNPFHIVNPQTYAKKRITETKVVFDAFDYHSKFDMDGDTAYFREKFVDHRGKRVRKQAHKMHMATQKVVLAEATDAGFLLVGKIDLGQIGYDHQFIYVLQKPE